MAGIEEELDRIESNVADALAATAEMGASVPETANSDNLGALIRSIPRGGASIDELKANGQIGYTEIADILPETTVEFDEEGSCIFPDVLDVRAGNTYTVKWNGVEYTCVALSFDIDGEKPTVLGDMEGVIGTGEPFYIVFFNAADAAANGFGCLICPLDGSASATLSITGEVVHKLDEKYLPSTADTTILYTSDNDIYLHKNHAVGDAKDIKITNNELKSLWLGGGKVLLYCENYSSSGVLVSKAWINPTFYFEGDGFGALALNTTGTYMRYTAEYTGD